MVDIPAVGECVGTPVGDAVGTKSVGRKEITEGRIYRKEGNKGRTDGRKEERKDTEERYKVSKDIKEGRI